MDLEQAKKFVDEMEADEERWVRKMGGRDVIAWIVAELQRRRELRETREAGARKPLKVATPAALASSSEGPSASLVRRIEVLEAQLKHLTKRLEQQRLI